VPSIVSTSEEPPSSLARAVPARAASPHCAALAPDDPAPRATLAAWLDAAAVLERRPLTARTRARLADFRVVAAELARVLDGVEDGEGRTSERTTYAATERGRVQALGSMFACPRATFVELLVSAPWNLLGPGDPPDPRTVRGAGTALVEVASRWSTARGCRGAVALQAATVRAAAFYERLGFRPMRADDDPLALVPSGERGWSASILRLAAGRPDVEERESPWMVLEPRAAAVAEAAGARVAG
jgi:GNAT superfamily N-acetyltransferase